jgi:ADP-heptose:LPS heptosyltransferase
MIKIGIIRNSSIGDVILATACIDLIAKSSVDCQIYWIGRKPALDILAKHFPSLVCVDYEKLESIANDLDLLVDLQVNTRTLVACWSLRLGHGIPFFRCRKVRLSRWLMVLAARLRGRRSRVLQPPGQFQFQIMAETVAKALRSLSLPPRTDCHPVLPQVSHEKARLLDEDRDWLAIAAGAQHLAKRAPANLFGSILAHLRERVGPERWTNMGLVFVGATEDYSVSQDIIDSRDWGCATLNACGKKSLTESIDIIAEAKAILGNDTSLGHAAEASGVPSAVLFGPTTERFGFAPWREESRAFSSDLGCRPCSRHGKTLCRYGDYRCFEEISAAGVANFLAAVFLKEKTV